MTYVRYDVGGEIIASYSEAKKLAQEKNVSMKTLYIPAEYNEELFKNNTKGEDE